MEKKNLYGIILVLSVALAGVCGYTISEVRETKTNLSNQFDELDLQSSDLQALLRESSSEGQMNTIIISGTGIAEGEPTVMNLEIGVTTEVSKAVGAQKALERNSESTNLVIEALKSLNIDEDNIETSQFDLSPTYNYDEGRELTGFRVNHTLNVKSDDLDSAGEIIDDAVEAGANEIGGIRFSLGKGSSEDLEELARERAAEDARSKAETIAETLGVEITGVLRVSEGSVSYQSLDEYSKIREASGKTQIMEPTSLRKAVTLNVVFQID